MADKQVYRKKGYEWIEKEQLEWLVSISGGGNTINTNQKAIKKKKKTNSLSADTLKTVPVSCYHTCMKPNLSKHCPELKGRRTSGIIWPHARLWINLTAGWCDPGPLESAYLRISVTCFPLKFHKFIHYTSLWNRWVQSWCKLITIPLEIEA